MSERRSKRNFLAQRRAQIFDRNMRQQDTEHEAGSITLDDLAQQVKTLQAENAVLRGIVCQGDGDQFEDEDVPAGFPVRAEPDPPDLMNDVTAPPGDTPDSTAGTAGDALVPAESEPSVGETATAPESPVESSSSSDAASGGIDPDNPIDSAVQDVTNATTDTGNEETNPVSSGDVAEAESESSGSEDDAAATETGQAVSTDDTGVEVAPSMDAPAALADASVSDTQANETSGTVEAPTVPDQGVSGEAAAAGVNDVTAQEQQDQEGAFQALEDNFDPAKKHEYDSHQLMTADFASHDADHLIVVTSDENYGGKRMRFWMPSDGNYLPLAPGQTPGGAFTH